MKTILAVSASLLLNVAVLTAGQASPVTHHFENGKGGSATIVLDPEETQTPAEISSFWAFFSYLAPFNIWSADKDQPAVEKQAPQPKAIVAPEAKPEPKPEPDAKPARPKSSPPYECLLSKNGRELGVVFTSNVDLQDRVKFEIVSEGPNVSSFARTVNVNLKAGESKLIPVINTNLTEGRHVTTATVNGLKGECRK